MPHSRQGGPTRARTVKQELADRPHAREVVLRWNRHRACTRRRMQQTNDSHNRPTPQQALDELTALRDRAKLRLALFSMTARDRWQSLETRLNDWEQRMDRDGEQMTESAIAKFRELMRNARELLNEPAPDSSPLATPVTRIMGRTVTCCSPEDPLNHAAQLMWDGDTSVVPVVDPNGRVIGMVSDRDVCMACYTQGCAPAQGTVASAMSRNVECCEQVTPIEGALRLMTEQRVRVLPVLDENRQVAGLITLGSIARFVEALSGDQQARGLFLLGRALAAVRSV